MCRHMYDWNFVNCDVKQLIHSLLIANSQPKRRGHKNVVQYQKYIGTSIKVGSATRSLYASSGPKAEGVPTNNQRGWGSGPCEPLRRFRQGPSYSPYRLVSQSATLKEWSVKGFGTRPVVLSMITGAYWRCRRRFTIFDPNEMKFVSPLTLLSL